MACAEVHFAETAALIDPVSRNAYIKSGRPALSRAKNNDAIATKIDAVHSDP